MNKSILIDDFEDRCYICGLWGHMEEHHIFGGPCRKTADRMGLVVHLCRECHRHLHDDHDGYKVKQYLHEVGQAAYEAQIGDREHFINDFIRSYL